MTTRFRAILTEPEPLGLQYGPVRCKVSQRFRRLDLREKALGPIRVSKRFAKLDFRDFKSPPLHRRAQNRLGSKRFVAIAKHLWSWAFPTPTVASYYTPHWIQITATNTSNNEITVRWTVDASSATAASSNVWTFRDEDLLRMMTQGS